MSARVISFINLKGGVAKTTTTVGTAECLACHGKRVLVIDLDPQTNGTIMMIGEERWKTLNDRGYTLATLFSDAVYKEAKFNLAATLQKNASDVPEACSRLFLLPSSLDFIQIQDALTNADVRVFGNAGPTLILRRAVRRILDDYDYVLIDCPPSLDRITKNGLAISDGYVIPTIPDILSTYGIPQVIAGISRFAEEIGQDIVCLGIVATKVDGRSNVHERTLRELRRNRDAPLFVAQFGLRNAGAAAAEHSTSMQTFRKKWGRDLADSFEEFVQQLEAKF